MRDNQYFQAWKPFIVAGAIVAALLVVTSEFGDTIRGAISPARVPSVVSRTGLDPNATVFELYNLKNRAASHSTPDMIVRLSPAFDPSKPITLVVYNHGLYTGIQGSFRDAKLADQMAGASPNTVLILPEWQRNPGASHSAAGQFANKGLFAAMVEEAFDLVPGLKGMKWTDVDDVIILAHSAGYKPAEAEIYNNGLDAKISAVILLDALYDHYGFDRWIQQNIQELATGKKRFYNIFHGTAGASKDQANRVEAMLKAAGLGTSSMVRDYNNGNQLLDAAGIGTHTIVFKYSSITAGQNGGPHYAIPMQYVQPVVVPQP